VSAIEGKYEVEDRGYETPCWIWQRAKTTAGYGETWNGRVVYAHRLSYELHVGPIPPGHDVHHRCEQRACLRPDHLQPKPHREHAAVKLTAEDAREIRRLVAEGHTHRPLAARFGVSARLVGMIARRERWATA